MSNNDKKGNNNDQTITHFTSEEYLEMDAISEALVLRGSPEDSPKFVIVMGGVGVGKTTIRKQQFNKGYVPFDFGGIYTAMKEILGEGDPRLTDAAARACGLILQKSLETKRNIVIEIVGDNQEVIETVVKAMKGIGYEPSLTFISCDPEEALKRHVLAVKEDPNYISSYFTQDVTLSLLYDQLGLGDMPETHNDANTVRKD